MNSQLEQSFIHIYEEHEYKHVAMVNRRGKAVAFATDAERKIYYTVLDFAGDKTSEIDAENWLPDLKLLRFPRAIKQAGYGNRTRPATAKDTLGAKDMEEKPFYETTKELDFFDKLQAGNFNVLLPANINELQSRQIFANDRTTDQRPDPLRQH